jgi:hypothetical protein
MSRLDGERWPISSNGHAKRAEQGRLADGKVLLVESEQGPPSGSVVHAGLWESNDKAEQMNRLNEMIADARARARARADADGVSFIPTVNHMIVWTI